MAHLFNIEIANIYFRKYSAIYNSVHVMMKMHCTGSVFRNVVINSSFYGDVDIILQSACQNAPAYN